MADETGEDVHMRVRIPMDLRVRLAQAAITGRRSQTAEIVSRLERSFETERLLERYRMQADSDAAEIQRLKAAAGDDGALTAAVEQVEVMRAQVALQMEAYTKMIDDFRENIRVDAERRREKAEAESKARAREEQERQTWLTEQSEKNAQRLEEAIELARADSVKEFNRWSEALARVELREQELLTTLKALATRSGDK